MIEPGPSTVTDPTDSDDGCPGCGTTTGVQPQPAPPTVQAWTCTACGMDWATTVVNPNVRAALAVIGCYPRRSSAQRRFDLMRSEVHRRSGKEHTMAETVCLPATELFNLDPLASVDVTG